MENKPYFIQLVVQPKASNDWRAFIYCKKSSNSRTEIEFRGYGSTMDEAISDVKKKYNELCEELNG